MMGIKQLNKIVTNNDPVCSKLGNPWGFSKVVVTFLKLVEKYRDGSFYYFVKLLSRIYFTI